jgi:hypothetical protein
MRSKHIPHRVAQKIRQRSTKDEPSVIVPKNGQLRDFSKFPFIAAPSIAEV